MTLAPYQRAWIEKIENPTLRKIVWVAARHASKSWTTALGLARFSMKHPGIQISVLPGGKQDQGKEFLRYFKAFIPAAKRDMRCWGTIEAALVNGSKCTVLAPTEAGVESKRAHVLVVEEAQLVRREILEMALPQVGQDIGKVIFIGTSKFPSVLNEQWNSAPENCRQMDDWRQSWKAGIVNAETLRMIRQSMSKESWDEFYNCRWVHKSEFIFVIPDVDLVGRPDMQVIGVDCNLSPGHVWVSVVRDNGRIVAVDEGVLQDIASIEMMPRAEIVMESNGANMGFVAEAQKVRNVIADDWGGRKKEGTIERVKILQDRKMLAIARGRCPLLRKGLEEAEFNDEGKMVKNDSKKFLHYVDAWLHAANHAGREQVKTDWSKWK